MTNDQVRCSKQAPRGKDQETCQGTTFVAPAESREIADGARSRPEAERRVEHRTPQSQRRIDGRLGGMRTSGKCIKCGSLAIGHLSRLFDETGERGAKFSTAMLGVDGTTRQGAGPLEACVCTECGYVETYVTEPAAVSFEKLQGFRWVNEPNARRGTFR